MIQPPSVRIRCPLLFVPQFFTEPEPAWGESWGLATASRCTIRTRRVDPWAQTGRVLGLRPHVLAQLVRPCACLGFAKDRGPWDAIGCASW
jgi:hypothetical protein